MALTPEQLKYIEQNKAKREGIIPARTVSREDARRLLALDDVQEKVKEKEDGFFSRVGESLKQRGSEIKKTFGQAASGKISPLETGVRVVGDVIGGAGDVVGEAISPAVEPVIKKIAETDLGKKAFEAMESGMDKFNQWKTESPENQRIGEMLEGFGNIASILPIGKAAQLGKKAASESIEASLKAGAKVESIATKGIQPVAKGTKNVGEYVISQATGMTPETIETIIKNPEQFTKAQIEGLQRFTLADKVKGALDTRINELGNLGKEYQALRESGQKVQLPEFGYREFLRDEFKLETTPEGKIIRTKSSIPMTQQDVSAVEEFLSIFGNESQFTSDEFLNVRKALDNVAKFDTGKTDSSRKVAKALRSFHDKFGKEQLKGLQELDLKYAPEAETLSKLKKDFFDKDGTLKDTAINRIANVTGKGKDLQLERLKELIPDIEEQVKILKALEDIEYSSGRTVGAYMRGGLGAVGIATGSPLAILGAIASTPKVIVPILTKFGTPLVRSREEILKIIEKIQQGRKLGTQEQGIVKQAIEAAGAAIGGGGTAGVIDQLKEQEP